MSHSSCPCAPVCPVADFEYYKLNADYFLREYPWACVGIALLVALLMFGLFATPIIVTRLIVQCVRKSLRQPCAKKGKRKALYSVGSRTAKPPTTNSIPVAPKTGFEKAAELGIHVPSQLYCNEDYSAENIFAQNRWYNRDNNNQGQGKKGKNKGGDNNNNNNNNQNNGGGGKKGKNGGGGNNNNGGGGNNNGGCDGN